MSKRIQRTHLSVGEVAKRSGVKVSTLHFYEDKELIHSTRNAGNQRRYSRDVLRRIGVIKAAQKVGICLNEIKQALAFLPKDKAPTNADWQRLSKQWKDHLEQQIRYLSELRDNITSCIGCGCMSLKVCPIYNADDQLRQKESGAVLLNKSAKHSA